MHAARVCKRLAFASHLLETDTSTEIVQNMISIVIKTCNNIGVL